MSDWAAKVLEGVGRIWAYSYEVNEADNGAEPEDWKTFQTWDVADPYPILGKEYVAVDDALAAIASMGAGDGLVERLNRADEYEPLGHDGWEAAAHIVALTAERRTLRLVIEANIEKHRSRAETAEAERDALRAKVARLEGVLTDMPKAVLRTTVCQGPQWPDDRPGVWLAALEACAKSVQAAVDAALTDGAADE